MGKKPLTSHPERSEGSPQLFVTEHQLLRSFASLRVCDFSGFLAIFAQLSPLFAMSLLANIQKSHKPRG
jgi:hypothetical protein